MLKSYNFWIRLVAVLVLLLRIIGSEFGLSIDSGLIIDLATAVASVLVVLGVIQVPVDTAITTTDGVNKNGGENMNFNEKIKEDIILAKDKLITNFENNPSALEIIGLLDNILGTSLVEKVEEVKAESEVGEVSEVIIEPLVNQTNLEEVAIEENEETLQTSLVQDELSSQNEIKEDENLSLESEPSCVDDTLISDETEVKLHELLKAKIREVLERDLDEIIAQIS